jgi:hypothetical protein
MPIAICTLSGDWLIAATIAKAINLPRQTTHIYFARCPRASQIVLSLSEMSRLRK